VQNAEADGAICPPPSKMAAIYLRNSSENFFRMKELSGSGRHPK
jgi:hypothetical protein